MIPDNINIQTAEYLGTFTIQFRFSDNSIQTIDFGPFLKGSVHPDIRRWLDENLFKTYQLKHGDIIWGDYELCFPIADLYLGDICHKASWQNVI